MKRLLKNKNFIIKWGLLVLFFGLGYLYEKPQDMRQGYLLGLFTVLMLGQVFATLNPTHTKRKMFFFGIMLAAIVGIEQYTSFVMNYFFHFLYLILLIDALLSFPQKMSWLMGTGIVLLSLRKYLYLYNYQKRPETFAEIVFFVLMTLIIFVASSFSRYYQDEKNEKEILYRQMLGKNEALRLYSEKVATLSATEERSRIARDLHDQLGHQLTGLVMELEMIDYLIGDSEGKEKKLIVQAKGDARETLTMVRNIVEQVKETQQLETESSVLKMIDAFKERTFIEVIYENKASDNVLPWLLIKQLLTECLTNAARYSSSDQVMITLTEKEKELQLRIYNDGKYEDVLVIGNGINGMKERLRTRGGRVEINRIIGFEILCCLPREAKDD